MPFYVILANRLEKIIGTLVKTFAYIFHFIFPNFRFTIPSYQKPLIVSKKQYKIPRIIWQTNFTSKASLPVYANYLFNRLMGFDFEYRFLVTADRDEYMKKYAPQRYLDAYNQLTVGAAQADLWRLFVLYNEGGVYMDIDAHAVWPLSKILPPEQKELFLMTKHRYSNYFIASAPANEYLKKCIDIVVSNIEEKNLGNGVYDLTGPTTLNKAIGDDEVAHRHNKITCIQGSFTNEYFQYIDRPKSKWTHVDKNSILKDTKGA